MLLTWNVRSLEILCALSVRFAEKSIFVFT